MTTAEATVARPRAGIHWRRLARRHAWTVGIYLLLLVALPLLADDSGGVGHVRRAVARDRRAALRVRRDGPVRRHHLGRHRPLGRLADGPRQRPLGEVHARRPADRRDPVVREGDRDRDPARRRRRPRGRDDRADHPGDGHRRHHRHARDALRVGRCRARGDGDPRRRCSARVHQARRRLHADAMAADRPRHPRRRRALLGADPLAEARSRHLRHRHRPQRLVPRRHLGQPDSDRRLRARLGAFAAWAGSR